MLKPFYSPEGAVRIVVLSAAAELGGAERSLITFLKSARSRGIDATVVLPREGRLTHELSQIEVAWRIVPPPESLLTLSRGAGAHALGRVMRESPRVAGYVRRVARLLDELAPHVIYTNSIKSHILGAMLRPLVRRPVVWHVRDVWSARAMGLAADLGADHVIANSQATALALREHMRRPRKVSVVYNAVDAEEFSPEGPTALCGNASSDEWRIGLPAMMTRIKGHELLLRAAPRVGVEFPSARLYFIGGTVYDTMGDRDYEARLRDLVSRTAPAERVVFTGFQERMAPWYRAMDVVVNASVRPEGFGRTVLEAMSCGRAVVAPDAGGIREFVLHGENGLLYPMGDADALAQAVIELLRDERLRRRLGEEGRSTAVKRFGVEPYVDAVAGILMKIASRNRAIPRRTPWRSRVG